MSDSAAASGKGQVPILGPFLRRPRLVGAIGLGLAVALGLWLIPNPYGPATRAIFVWDAGCFSFIAMTLLMMRACDVSEIAARAAKEDEGQHFILTLAIVAAVFSMGAIVAELSLAKNDQGFLKLERTLLAFGTVLGSWLFVQTVFALHYAHEYYSEAPEEGGRTGGLAFPDDDDPDYWDFLHFACVVGVAAQTADVAFTSKSLRRTGTVHCMVAFVFNTVVLALTINLLAGLF